MPSVSVGTYVGENEKWIRGHRQGAPVVSPARASLGRHRVGGQDPAGRTLCSLGWPSEVDRPAPRSFVSADAAKLGQSMASPNVRFATAFLTRKRRLCLGKPGAKSQCSDAVSVPRPFPTQGAVGEVLEFASVPPQMGRSLETPIKGAVSPFPFRPDTQRNSGVMTHSCRRSEASLC